MKILIIWMAVLNSLSSTINLTGRWETKPSEKGNITGVVFKDDDNL